MNVVDPFGNRKDYTAEKIVNSVMRSGFNREHAEQIEERVRERVHDGMSTKELYRIVYEEMRKINETYARRYRLREAIGALNTNYHEFEKYMAKVLSLHGYDTKWSPRPLPQGACSEHEVDIVATNAEGSYAVECKHHYHYHRITGMSVPMLQWAVLQDLKEGHESGLQHSVDVDKAWVIVNTKLSQHAKDYAECKGIRMMAWNYPDGNSLREIVEAHTAYPITILDLRPQIKTVFSKHDILTMQDVLELDDPQELNMRQSELEDVQREARRCIDHD